jgi:hypothetical protein
VWVNSVEAFAEHRNPRQNIGRFLEIEQRLSNAPSRTRAEQATLEHAQGILENYRLPGVALFQKVSRGHKTILLCLVTGGTTIPQLKKEIIRHLIENWEEQDYAVYHDLFEIALGRRTRK